MAMLGMNMVTTANRLLHFMIILPYCGALHFAVIVIVIVFVAVSRICLLKVYHHKTSPAKILIR